jgi:hypothetical protein
MFTIRRMLAAVIVGLAMATLGATMPTAATAAPGARAALDSVMCTLFDGCHENCAGEKGCKVHEKCDGTPPECQATVASSSCAPGTA